MSYTTIATASPPSILSKIGRLGFMAAIAAGIELPSNLYSTEMASKYALSALFFPPKDKKIERAKLISSLCLHSPCQRKLMSQLIENPVNVEPNEWKTFTKIFSIIPFHESESITTNTQLMDFHHLLTSSNAADGDEKPKLTGNMVGDRLCKLFTMYMAPQGRNPISTKLASGDEVTSAPLNTWTYYWSAAVGSLDSDIGEINRKMKPKYSRIDSELLFAVLYKLDECDKQMVTKY